MTRGTGGAFEPATRETAATVPVKWIVEAMLFAASEPLSESEIQAQVAPDADVRRILAELRADYADRGVRLEQVEQRWAFRTAVRTSDLRPANSALVFGTRSRM